ncbi:MAG: hypothetical protein AAGJ31_05360, partial [Verrucomicrobiota bacterium]
MTVSKIQDMLDERPKLKGLVSVLGSVFFNLFIMCGGALLFLAAAPAPPPPGEEKANEVVIQFEELIPELLSEEETDPELRPFLDTYEDQVVAEAPEDARFESDKNTESRSEMRSKDPSAPEVPAQEGDEEIKSIVLRNQEYLDGPEEFDSPQSAAMPAGVPVPRQNFLQMPQEETLVQAEAMEAPVESQNETEDPEAPDPEASEYVEIPSKAKDLKAVLEELEEGDKGGAEETLEMANVDLAKTQSSFSDSLEVLEESMVIEEGPMDSMPEKAPDLVDPQLPFAMAPTPAPTAPKRTESETPLS